MTAVSRGHFRVVGCRAFRLDFEEGLGDEPEEMALFLPIMRQVFAQPQEPGRCYIAWHHFGSSPRGWRRVQAICDIVCDHLTFGYEPPQAFGGLGRADR